MVGTGCRAALEPGILLFMASSTNQKRAIWECLELLSESLLVERRAPEIEYPGRLRSVRKLLAKHVAADQAARRDYQNNYLKKYPEDQWQKARADYTKDKGTSNDDVFGDAARQKVHQAALWKLQHRDLKKLAQDPKTRENLFLAGQHSDNDVALQKKIHAAMPKRTLDWRMMHDRISVATGKPQRYGTQRVSKDDESK